MIITRKNKDYDKKNREISQGVLRDLGVFLEMSKSYSVEGSHVTTNDSLGSWQIRAFPS